MSALQRRSDRRRSSQLLHSTPKTWQKIYLFDFEMMHENGKHTANYVCAISQDGEKFIAGLIVVDKMVKDVQNLQTLHL